MTFYDKDHVVHLAYHFEDDSWWADSPDLPSLFAGGDTLAEAKELARQVVADELGDDVLIMEWMPVPGSLAIAVTRGAEPSSGGVIGGWAAQEVEVTQTWGLPEQQPA